jgi:hypothetical protein
MKQIYGVRLVNFDLTHWFSSREAQVDYANRCGFAFALVELIERDASHA